MSKGSSDFYAFGPFRVDPSERTLFHRGKPVPLPPKTFDMLLVLIENRGRVLSKSELLSRVWPDAAVEEANLSHHVFALRKVLGEDKQEAKYIETVPRRGYRFTAAEGELDEEKVPAEEDGMLKSGGIRGLGERTSFWAAAAVLVIITTAAITSAALVRLARQSKSAPIRSIAVLPFKPLVADSRQEALEIGFADTLITKLSGLYPISVRPVGAVRRFAGLEQDPVAAGRELRVDTVLDGSIQRSGERLRVTVRFLRVEDGRALWNGAFDEKFTDTFAVQDAVTAKVVSSLPLHLSSEEREHLAKRETQNVEAYDRYLLGRYFVNQRTADGFQKGIQHFRDALRLDSGYAPAYSGIADSFSARGMYGDLAPKDAFEEAKAAAFRAIELDSSLAEAHISLGLVREWYDWDFAGAEREYRRGLELNPGYATGHQRYGVYLNCRRRIPEANLEFSRALSLDPVSAIANVDAARPIYSSRSYQKASEQLRKAIEIDPGFHRAHAVLAHCYTQMGRYDEAVREARRAVELSSPDVEPIHSKDNYQVAYIKAKWGQTREARLMLDSVERLQGASGSQVYFRALAYAALQDTDHAFVALEDLYRSRNPELLGIACDPAWDLLRGDSRFTDLLRRIGLPP